MKPTTNHLLPALGLAACLASAACVSYAAEPMIRHGVLTGDHGMTLYTFDKDKANSRKSLCNGFCAQNWPPFLASASDVASGNYSFVVRDDGKVQWAYKGKPLYFWHKDMKPGDMTGDGFKNVWHVARR